MNAIVADRYGSPADLAWKDVADPVPKRGEVLVDVAAAGANPSDVLMLKGEPFFLRFTGMGLFRPRHRIPGSDVAGRVAAVGGDVRAFAPGDRVFANLVEHGRGAFAERVAASASAWVPIPESVSDPQAAAAPMAAVTALQGLQTHGRLQPGQRVLIHGASGGVGTFAVQIAKALGAEVTAVCSTRNVARVLDLGADRVIDYTAEDFVGEGRRYHLIFDTVANRTVAEYEGALADGGSFVTTGMLPPLMLRSPERPRGPRGLTMRNMMATPDTGDLAFVARLMAGGEVTSAIDRCYPLAEAADALAYVAEGHAQGKVVVQARA